MRTNLYRRLGTCAASFVLGLGPLAVLGQSQTGDRDTPTLYKIEVIVFANNRADPNEERFAHIASRTAPHEPAAIALPEIREFDFDALAGPEDAGGETAVGTDAPFAAEEGRPEPDFQAGADNSGSADSGPEGQSGLDGPNAEGQIGPDGQPRPEAQIGSDTQIGPDGSTESTEAELASPFDPFGPGSGNAIAGFRFRVLTEEELALGSVRRTIDNDGRWTPVLHGGWIQEGLPDDAARAFDLAYLGRTNPAGTVRLHVNRFPQVTLDLHYRPRPDTLTVLPGAEDGIAGSAGGDDARTELPGGPLGSSSTVDRQPGSGGFGAPGRPLGGARVPMIELDVGPRYILQGQRRLRSGVASFFDHPFFGVIILVEPYEPPAEEAAAEGLRPAA